MSNEKPPEKPTLSLAKPPDWAISIIEKVNQLVASNARVEANQELLVEDVRGMKSDIRELQRWRGTEEERRDKHSGGIRQISQSDVKQDAAIATLITDVADLKETQSTQLDILKRLDAVAANPMVRRVAYAVGGAVLAYLASKGWLTR